MATVVNDRDVLIMGASPRFNPPTDRGMFLTPPASIFKVSSDGLTASPSSFTFTATLLNMTGTVTWSYSGGIALSINGNTATLSFASFSAVSGTITASITVDGQPYSQTVTVSKVADGAVTYTWVKYADSAAGNGLSDDPTGKSYIGLAYNKSTAIESTVASDYAWSLIKGTDGVPGAKGADGATLYTWIKYSDVADGTGLYDTPTASTQYIGLAVNKATATESTLKTDYVWSKFKGDQGVPGNPGAQGIRGNVDIAAVTTGSVWSDSEAVAALTAAGWGAPQNRDLVKLYKSDRTFSAQKMYNGSAWVAVDYVYDGSVFVKGSILPEAIDTRGLTVKDAQGNLILGAGSALPTSYLPAGALNSNVSISSNGALSGGGGGQVTIGGLGYTGALNATYGATIGVNLGGQMTAANISTFIAAAAIGLALIDKASIGNLQALSATIGLLRTATSGARVEIADNLITGYRSNNTMSFKISS
jgi:hypothetical protein